MNRVEMVNIALTELGAKRISSLNDTSSEEARVMNALYEPILEEVLSLYEWPSVTARKRLAQLSVDNLTKWEYIYQIPDDVVWIITMLDPDSLEEMDLSKGSSRPSPSTSPFFEREGSYLYTDYDECIIKYIKFPSDLKGLRDIIGNAIALKMAASSAVRLGRDMKLSATLEQRYEVALLRAKSADSLDRRSVPKETKSWGEYR